jgi:outer membrane protein
MKYLLHIFCFFNLFVLSLSSSYAEDLVGIYEVALKNDPELLAAESNHKATMQKFPIARSFLLPNLNFSATSKRTRESIEGSVYGRSSSSSE